MKEFYDRGGRYMSLAHNGNSQLADSNTGETQGYLYNNGLSPLGRQVIAEMNRLGMMVDLSHPSKGADMEAMRLSKAPVIASHSGVRALANVSRNMDDEQLLALKKNGGVIQVVGVRIYVKTDSKERTQALDGAARRVRASAGTQPAGAAAVAAAARGRGGGGGASAAGSAGGERQRPRRRRAGGAPGRRARRIRWRRSATERRAELQTSAGRARRQVPAGRRARTSRTSWITSTTR